MKRTDSQGACDLLILDTYVAVLILDIGGNKQAERVLSLPNEERLHYTLPNPVSISRLAVLRVVTNIPHRTTIDLLGFFADMITKYSLQIMVMGNHEIGTLLMRCEFFKGSSCFLWASFFYLCDSENSGQLSDIVSFNVERLS